MNEFAEWVTAQGFDPENLSDTQKRTLQMAWRASLKAEDATAEAVEDTSATVTEDKPKADPAMDEILARTRAENRRREAITKLVAQHLDADPRNLETYERIGRLAIDGKWTEQKAELEMLRASRGAGPIAYAPSSPQLTPKVMEAALCRAGGLQNVEKHFSEQTLEAADRQYKRGLGIGEVVLHYARQNGYTGRSIKEDPWGAIKAALNGSPVPQPHAAAWGPSTGGGLSAVLSNTGNKFLREGFNFVEGQWREIAARRTVSDFKQVSTYSVTGGLTHEELPPGGEIKHGTLGAETYTNQVSTYARMLGIDRRDLVNDDLGAFTTVGRKLGRGAAITLNKKFWGVFLNNSAFFTSGRNNVSTGGGSALALAGLNTAYQTFVAQTDPDGNILGATPRILLVPPALSATAMQLMSPMLTIGSGTAATGSTNPWAGMFRVVSSAYMQDTTLTGNSNAAWYLLADPQDVPVIEVAFLNGVESPTVETAEADFNMLGIVMRAYLDYGIALQEYRGGVRSAGS